MFMYNLCLCLAFIVLMKTVDSLSIFLLYYSSHMLNINTGLEDEEYQDFPEG
jgi:hypothetical protein